MNKAELISAVADRADDSKARAAVMVDAVFDCILEALKNGEEVKLPSFGSFVVAETAVRKARNPQTNEEVIVPAGLKARFKPGKALKDALDEQAAKSSRTTSSRGSAKAGAQA